MRSFARKISLEGALAIAIAVLAGPALSCTKCGAANAGKGCGQLVTVKHPDLKGPARKKEWDRCMADPAAYNG